MIEHPPCDQSPLSKGSEIYMLDSMVLLDMIKNPSGMAGQRFKALLGNRVDAELCTSVIVQCELEDVLSSRLNPRWMQHYHGVMEALHVLPLQSNSAPYYASLQQHSRLSSLPIKPQNLLIAAHALAMGAILISDKYELAEIPGLRHQNWLS
jgi:tRNA(fMet)-specific endonuclease VapC